MDYQSFSDEKLAEMAKAGDSVAMEVLINRCRQMVLSVARTYFLTGGDTEDLIQEGMIGVFKAVTNYDCKSNFKAYAFVCVKTSILSLIKKYSAEKHKPLNNYFSLSGNPDFDCDKTDIAVDENFEPEKEYINNESVLELRANIKNVLSNYENQILGLYLQGYSYDEIANMSGKNVKSIDNAIQRIRKKLSSREFKVN